MEHVVSENCTLCRYIDRVEVRPVDGLHEGAKFLVTDPD
ncbi:hypothetical protein HDE76_003253 [Rhodanobacter sp. ANJX3]|nr:hypothetical protein [Rhodanobacter sp. ANJX3]